MRPLLMAAGIGVSGGETGVVLAGWSAGSWAVVVSGHAYADVLQHAA